LLLLSSFHCPFLPFGLKCSDGLANAGAAPPRRCRFLTFLFFFFHDIFSPRSFHRRFLAARRTFSPTRGRVEFQYFKHGLASDPSYSPFSRLLIPLAPDLCCRQTPLCPILVWAPGGTFFRPRSSSSYSSDRLPLISAVRGIWLLDNILPLRSTFLPFVYAARSGNKHAPFTFCDKSAPSFFDPNAFRWQAILYAQPPLLISVDLPTGPLSSVLLNLLFPFYSSVNSR